MLSVHPHVFVSPCRLPWIHTLHSPWRGTFPAFDP
jgi:hypothetical protein